MTEIIGGLSIKNLSEGNVEFETRRPVIKPDEAIAKSTHDYYRELQNHSLLDALVIDDSQDDEMHQISEESFEKLALKMNNLLPSGAIKKLRTRTGYGIRPSSLSLVKIHYNAYTEYQIHPFDSTYSRKKPFTFIIGEGQCIEGLEIAVESLQISEKALFLINPELAYKDSGFMRVPPNSTVLFQIELLEILENAPEKLADQNRRDFSFVYKICSDLCITGKQKFRLRDFSGAARDYEVAIKRLKDVFMESYEQQVEADKLFGRLYTNALICYTQLKMPKRGCFYANQLYDLAKNKTLQIGPKVYYNNAKCLSMLGDFSLATKRLELAKRLAPNLPKIEQEFHAIIKAEEEYLKRQKRMATALVN